MTPPFPGRAEFVGKSVLITGASSGIGLAAAQAFAREGASLTLGDVQIKALESAAASLRASGVQVQTLACDVSQDAQVKALVDLAVASYGSLDAAFNNAGITSYADTFDTDVWNRMVGINLNGVMFGMKYQLAQMRKQKSGGAIVNTASIAGLSAAGTAEYCATKHAVIGLTREAGVRYAPEKIRVNAICPGVIETGMTAPLLDNHDVKIMMLEMCPIGRVGQAAEVAEAVLFLASARASFITGAALPVDGGYMAS